jgi:hypothetical protein
MNTILPLIVGGVIYISFRSKSLRMFNWFENIEVLNSTRNLLYPMKKFTPSWVYYSLPDALWMYSFSSIYLLIWKDQINEGKYWLLIPLVFGCSIEFAQGLNIFEGTYDLIDLIACLLAFIISIIINNPRFQKNEKQKQVF